MGFSWDTIMGICFIQEAMEDHGVSYGDEFGE